MKFAELSNQEKINAVRDIFVNMLNDIASDKSLLNKYLKAPVAPKDNATDEEKASFEIATKHYAQVEEILAKTVPEEGCICGTCVKFSFDKVVPEALNFLKTIAKNEAQEKRY